MVPKTLTTDTVGFIWEPQEEAWNKGYSYLLKYYRREGHCKVDFNWCEEDYSLGNWVSKQRFKKAHTSREKIDKLDKIGFIWNLLDRNWDEAFICLQKFHALHGHNRVPDNFEFDGFNLGGWVSQQRTSKKGLQKYRIDRLNEAGFIWDARDQKWEEGLSYLQEYFDRETHVRVHFAWKENGYPLGRWVDRQRRVQDSISQSRRDKLNKLGFIWAASKDKT